MAVPYPYTFTVLFDISNNTYWDNGFELNLSQLDVDHFGTGNIYDITDTVQSIKIGGGYDLIQNQFNTNKGTIRVIDTDGTWNPQNTASPFYGQLVPLRKIRVSVNAVDGTGAITQQAVYGTYFTIGYNYSYPQNQAFGYVDIDVMDAFRIFNMTNVSTIPGAVAGQTTGQRINAILDAIQWPASMRNIATGNQICGADPGTNRTALNAIKNVEFVEQGAFFVDDYGNATFLDSITLAQRNALYGDLLVGLQWEQSVIDYDKDPSFPKLYKQQYSKVTMAYDDKLIVNQTTAQMNGGVAQTVSDAASVATYFPHTVTQTQLVGSSDFQMMNLAGIYTATRKDTTIRFDAMVIDFTQPFWAYNWGTSLPPALTSYYVPLQPIKITNNQYNGASTISKVLQIVGSNIFMTPTQFTLTLTTSEALVDGFILGTPPKAYPPYLGILDKSVLGYY